MIDRDAQNWYTQNLIFRDQAHQGAVASLSKQSTEKGSNV